MKYPDYYHYPAVFQPDGGMWMATFPDIENAFTSADTLEEAVAEAQAVLEECLYFREAQNDIIPLPTPVEEIAQPAGGQVRMMTAAMPPVRWLWGHSEANMNYLKKVTSEIDSGVARLEEHELIEV